MNKGSAVRDVVAREVRYWHELAEREGCKTDIEVRDETTRLIIEHPTLAEFVDRVYIYVSPARGGRIDTQTSIYRTRKLETRRQRRTKKLTRKDARYAIEGMVSLRAMP